MYMTDVEILQSWNQAKDQPAQLGVLADLNAVSKAEMRDKLLALGAENVPVLHKRMRPGRSGPEKGKSPNRKLDELRAMELYNEGLCDLDLAEALGVSKPVVCKWRSYAKVQTAGADPSRTGEDQDRTGQEGCGPGKEEPVEKNEHMGVEGLHRITEQMKAAFPQAVLTADGRFVRDVRVNIWYGADGESTRVEMELILEKEEV